MLEAGLSAYRPYSRRLLHDFDQSVRRTQTRCPAERALAEIEVKTLQTAARTMGCEDGVQGRASDHGARSAPSPCSNAAPPKAAIEEDRKASNRSLSKRKRRAPISASPAARMLPPIRENTILRPTSVIDVCMGRDRRDRDLGRWPSIDGVASASQ